MTKKKRRVKVEFETSTEAEELIQKFMDDNSCSRDLAIEVLVSVGLGQFNREKDSTKQMVGVV